MSSLSDRRAGIGGSDAAAILGISPFRTALEVWAEKRGLVESRVDTPAMEWGRRLEVAVREKYQEATGRRVLPGQREQHPLHEWMFATLDGVSVAPGDERRVLECKTARAPDGRWADLYPGDEDRDCGDRVPDYYYAQVQHYLAVTGLERADVAVLFRAAPEFRIYPILRNEEFIERLIAAEERFWRRYVLPGDPPEPGGSEQDARILAALHPTDTGEVIAGGAAEVALLESLRSARAAAATAERIATALENQVKARMGDATILDCGPAGRVTWKRSRDQERVDWEAVARDLQASDELISQRTTIRPGGRRFVVPREWSETI